MNIPGSYKEQNLRQYLQLGLGDVGLPFSPNVGSLLQAGLAPVEAGAMPALAGGYNLQASAYRWPPQGSTGSSVGLSPASGAEDSESCSDCDQCSSEDGDSGSVVFPDQLHSSCTSCTSAEVSVSIDRESFCQSSGDARSDGFASGQDFSSASSLASLEDLESGNNEQTVRCTRHMSMNGSNNCNQSPQYSQLFNSLVGNEQVQCSSLNDRTGWASRYHDLRRSSQMIGASTVAIDNKIEQAMDLVKSHLMYAVREEVDVLREQIKDLLEKNSRLEMENKILRQSASPETLALLKAHQQPASVPNNTVHNQPPLQQHPPATS